ncbi:hypothetical protein RhiirA4_485937 [Rhizophagus irregularis]|uniref:Uncharacterized protein n=1 Tax=Rhizophagus irregularis TaxID=588596 RepID=A0A2I1HQR8_9GLOM|nr:hypothetical protein RhiirA4_485937 [Rhizophagus irregularis]
MSNKPNFNCKEYILVMQQLDLIYIYNSANLSSGVKIHAASEFHQKLWFSDVEITMDIDYQGNYEGVKFYV